MKTETIEKYQRILKIIDKDPTRSHRQIAELADTSPRTVSRAIDWGFKNKTPPEKKTKNRPDKDKVLVDPFPAPVDVVDDYDKMKFEFGYPKYTMTKDTVAIMFTSNDESPTIIDRSHLNFESVCNAIKLKDWEFVVKNSTVKKAIRSLSDGLITIEGGNTVYYNGFEISNSLTAHVLGILGNGKTPLPLLRFLENLMENPEQRAVNELYNFIKRCDLPITEDGHFIAYKKVNEDYTDCRTSKIDNSVGSKPKMPRTMVDTNKNKYCSHGFHFCSKEYLKSFGGSRIMAVKIDPADVVSIPADYNETKGRCWTYEVVFELEPGQDLPSYYISGY